MSNLQRVDRLLSVKEIKANPRNARTHSKAQIRQIADSIKACGWTDGSAEESVGPTAVPEFWNIFWLGRASEVRSPFSRKGDPKCRRCVCE